MEQIKPIDLLNRYERGIYWLLIILLAVVVFISVLELVYLLVQSLFINGQYRLDHNELITLFGYFLLVLIGVELLDTIKAYIIRNEIHVEIIILLGVIAVARKVILLDPVQSNEVFYFGLGFVAIALGSCYYLIKKAGAVS